MSRSIILSLALLSLTVAIPASSQILEPTYEKVLVPIRTGVTPGAFGSQWTAAIAISNISDTPVDVQGHGACRIAIPCRPLPIPPRTTIYVNLIPLSDVPAAFLFVEPGRVNDLSITMRAFDESRQHLTWGASLPVVTRRDLFAGRFGIGDIPGDTSYRSTLRIFDFDATTPAAVRVLVFSVAPGASDEMRPGAADRLLVTFTPQFIIPTTGGGTIGHPAFASVALWLMPELAGAERVRVVIEPLDTTGDYWAMVSSTHNDTQHVTVITPR